MRSAFADTWYWINLFDPHDNDHEAARIQSDAVEKLDIRVITSEMVFVEFLAAYSYKGAHLRLTAADVVTEMRSRDDVLVIPQSKSLFDEALNLYRNRRDKEYSLTDCASFVLIRRNDTEEALTRDRHFLQEGSRLFEVK